MCILFDYSYVLPHPVCEGCPTCQNVSLLNISYTAYIIRTGSTFMLMLFSHASSKKKNKQRKTNICFDRYVNILPVINYSLMKECKFYFDRKKEVMVRDDKINSLSVFLFDGWCRTLHFNTYIKINQTSKTPGTNIYLNIIPTCSVHTWSKKNIHR